MALDSMVVEDKASHKQAVGSMVLDMDHSMDHSRSSSQLVQMQSKLIQPVKQISS